jgi:hypothetical protein
MSIPQIARATNLAISTVRTRLLESGVQLRSRAEGVRLRSDDIATVQRGTRRKPTSEETRQKIREAALRRGERDAAGSRITTSGYVEFTRGIHKGRSVHVVVMEERIGRRLLPDECVHHVDGDRSNNDPNSLALMTRAGHTRLHRLQDEMSGRTRERSEDGRWN